MLRKVLKWHVYLLIWVICNIETYTNIYTLGAGGSPGTPAPWVFIYMKLLRGWCYASSGVGLGWGGIGMITFLALAHMVGAMQTSCFLHLHTWSVLRNIMGWGWGGVGMITFLALADMVGSTQHHVSCTCTHGRCYATSWGGVGFGWGGVGMITFLALAHMVGATQHHMFLKHLHTWLVLRNIMFLALAHMVGATQHHVSCTCTHGRCYATSWGGVGVGWGGDDNVPCTCKHGQCYATSCL